MINILVKWISKHNPTFNSGPSHVVVSFVEPLATKIAARSGHGKHSEAPTKSGKLDML